MIRETTTRAVFLTAIFGVSALFGCAPEVPDDGAPPERVSAVLDPTTGVIPLPNDIALDPDGTLPAVGEFDDTAAGEFARWFDGLTGWLPESGASIPFDGELDPESVNAETVFVFAIGEDGALTQLASTATVETADGTSSIEVAADDGFTAGSRYGVIVTKGVKGANGNAVLEPLGLFFALSNEPLVDLDTNEVLNGQLAPDRNDPPELQQGAVAQAVALEGVRQAIEPLTQGLEGQGIARKDVAMAFTWTTSTGASTVLDPTTGVIPLPNTLALDEDGTFPGVALPALTAYNEAKEADPTLQPDAQVYFDQYLDSLHGWPNTAGSVPITVPVTAAIDTSTLTDETVQLWTYNGDGSASRITDVTYAYDAESSVIAIVPGESVGDFTLDTEYFAFVTTGVKGVDGSSLKAPLTIALGVQPHPIVDAAGASNVSLLDDAQAAQLEAVRAALAPIVATIEDDAGVDHREIASVWGWHTWRDVFVSFDPSTGDIPFPNAFSIGILPTDGLTGAQLALVEELNARDSVSVLGDGWISFSGLLDEDTISLLRTEDKTLRNNDPAKGSIGIAYVDGLPTLLDENEVTFEYVESFNKIIMRFPDPLRANTLHAGIVSTRLQGANGLPVKPSPTTVLLASPQPIYDADADENLVAQIPPGFGPLLEDARQEYAQLFTSAPLATGDVRSTIAGVFAFTTDEFWQPAQRARGRALAQLGTGLSMTRACEADNSCAADALLVSDPGAAYTSPRLGGAPVDLSNVETIQFGGQLETVTVSGNDDAGQSVLLDFNDMGREQVGVSLFVPKAQNGCAPPYAVVIHQHGLGGNRNGGVAPIVNAFAAECLATVMIDAPLHGGRSPSSQAGGALHPESAPADSGAGFLTADFVRSVHNFIQGIVDLGVLTQYIEEGALDGLVGANAGEVIDATKIGMFGVSLGGIFSTDHVALDAAVNVGVFNVPTGKLTYSLTEPSSVGAGLVSALEAGGVMQGTFDFIQTVSLIQWAADVVDPAAFASRLTRNTLDEVVYNSETDAYDKVADVDAAQVIVQMAVGDETNPNIGTRQLARAAGISEEDFERSVYEGAGVNHGFAFGDSTAGQCAREQAAEWLATGLYDGTAAFPADLDASTCSAR
jgi:hypothetical protein